MSVLTGRFVLVNSRPEPKPYPKFKLSVFKGDDFDNNDNKVTFTNEVPLYQTEAISKDVLCVPVKLGESNLNLYLLID